MTGFVDCFLGRAVVKGEIEYLIKDLSTVAPVFEDAKNFQERLFACLEKKRSSVVIGYLVISLFN